MPIAATVTIVPTVSGGSYVLEAPSEYRTGYFIPSVVWQALTGRPWIQAATANARREFFLTWGAMTGYVDLQDAFWYLCGEVCTFTDPLGVAYSVMRHPNQQKITFRAVKLRPVDAWLWASELHLLEAG